MAQHQQHQSANYGAEYEMLMMHYASGCLDQAQTMIVTAHLGLSDTGHDLLRDFSALGGDMLASSCAPVEMSANSLDKMLKNLDHSCEENASEATAQKPGLPAGHCLTDCIQENLKSTPQKNLKWKTFYPGIQFFDLPLEYKQSKAQLIKAAPGKQAPTHEHDGIEITLILDGAMIEDNRKYNVGDLIIHNTQSNAHSPKACPDQGCVCLTVSSQPMRLKGLARLLNPIIRMKF